MNRSIQILSIFFLLILASGVSAQTPCGIVAIDGPTRVDSGKPLVFKARLQQTSKSEFNWIVSLGSINKGQGTDEITIDTAGLGGLVLTATVELIGVPAGCKGVASITAEVALPAPACNLKFDEYGDIKYRDEQARLDNFAIQVSNWPKSSGIVLMSAGQKTFKGEVPYRLARAKSYLTQIRGMDSSRILTIDCGFSRELLVALYVIPVEGPMPTCEIFTRIPLSEVKFTKPRPKSAKKFR